MSPFIERYWACSDSPAHARELILPTGTVEVVINLVEDEVRIYDPRKPGVRRRLSGAVVSGPYARAFEIDPHQHASMLGVHFRAGAAPRFLGVAGTELADQHINLDLLLGSRAVELRERLCTASSTVQRFALLDCALLSLLSASRPEEKPAVKAALRALHAGAEAPRIGNVAADLGLSQRRLIQMFVEEVGLTPKLFSRIRRFQYLRDLMRGAASPDWVEIAVAAGYYDQSHMIRDFQEFSGLSPTTYIRQRSDELLVNHVSKSQG